MSSGGWRDVDMERIVGGCNFYPDSFAILTKM